MSEIELIVVGIGAIAGGFINSLAGGGTLITFPILMAVGIPALPANITNTVALCPGYLGGTVAQFKELSGNKKKLFFFGIAGALGGVTGGILLLITREATFRTLVPYLILLATGLLAVEMPVRRWQEQQVSRGETKHERELVKLFIVFLASIYGGYFGAGLGVILLAVLALLSHESLTRLNAQKQLIGLFVNIAAAIFFLFSGHVVWSAAVVMAIGALVGGVLGGLVANWIRPLVLRWIVVVLGVIIAICYFVK